MVCRTLCSSWFGSGTRKSFSHNLVLLADMWRFAWASPHFVLSPQQLGFDCTEPPQNLKQFIPVPLRCSKVFILNDGKLSSSSRCKHRLDCTPQTLLQLWENVSFRPSLIYLSFVTAGFLSRGGGVLRGGYPNRSSGIHRWGLDLSPGYPNTYFSWFSGYPQLTLVFLPGDENFQIFSLRCLSRKSGSQHQLRIKTRRTPQLVGSFEALRFIEAEEKRKNKAEKGKREEKN